MTALLFRIASVVGAVSLFTLSDAHAQDQERSDWLDIEVGKSVVLTTPRVPQAIAITDPEVATAVTLGVANKIQIQGTNLGTTDLIVQFGPGISPVSYEITVHRDLSDLVRRVDSIVEGEPPRVYPLGERIVMEGAVDDLDTLERLALVARIYDEEFVNLMYVRGDHQVQLEVVFAEVSRTAARQLGLNVLYGDGTIVAGMIGQGNSRPSFANNAILDTVNTAAGDGAIGSPLSSGIALGGFVQQINLTAVLGTLDDYKIAKILAQPTIVSLSGQKAQLLSGGEVPIPVPQGGAQQTQITIQYKEYGVKMWFVPTVLAGNVIDVQVYLEISELDFANGTSLAGITVPGFITRKGETHVRMENGMTFAVAGLLSETMTYNRVGVPGLGRLPLVGTLFRNVRHVRDEREVVMYVTPRLVRPLAPGEAPTPPGTAENNNPSDFELYLLGTDHHMNSRTESPTGAVGLKR
jgi:pilus assembly protein CpaC